MRSWNLLSAVGVAIVAAWLAVTNLAYAAEFSCRVPWYSGTDCGFPKFEIPAQGTLTIEVYSIRREDDGSGVTDAATFYIYDANKENMPVHHFSVSPGSTSTWKYDGKEAPLTATMRVNVDIKATLIVRGRYNASK